MVTKDQKPIEADPSAQGLIAFLSIAVNICVFCTICKRWIVKKEILILGQYLMTVKIIWKLLKELKMEKLRNC